MIRKLLLFLAGTTVFLATGVYGIVWYQANLPPSGETLPADYQYRFKNAFVETNYTTQDGAVLNTLMLKTPGAKGVIYFLHGGGGSLKNADSMAERFRPFQYDLALLDYRQFGKSTGVVSQRAFYDDTNLVYQELKRRYGEARITVLGHSLGCAIAANVAANNHPARLVLVEPFYNFITKAGNEQFPWYWPARTAYTFRTDEFVAKTTCPVYIFSGTNSNLYPAGKALTRLNPDLARFFSIEGADHVGIFNDQTYRTQLHQILR